MGTWLSLMAGLALAAVACSGSSATVPSPSTKLAPNQDCRGATETDPNSPKPAAGVTFVEMTVDGKRRDYRLYQPASLDTSKPVALVVMLHGSPADAAGFENLIHFDQEASSAGFLEAAPNGCDGLWSYAEGGPKQADDDFIQKVIEQLEARYSINKSRVFLAGASAGSWVEYRLACDLADQISAIASVAGTMRLEDDCKPAKPVSILEIHGTHDNAHPWNGGGPHHASPVDQVMQRWVSLDGCAASPNVTTSGITETSVWRPCQDGSVVRLDKVIGGRHTWFGSDLDPVPGEPNANSTIWSFFTSVTTA